MTMNLYSVRDVKSTYMSPVVGSNDAQAMRSFRAGMRAVPEFEVAPADFELYRIGEYNNESGMIIPTVPPVWICSGSEEV